MEQPALTGSLAHWLAAVSSHPIPSHRDQTGRDADRRRRGRSADQVDGWRAPGEPAPACFACGCCNAPPFSSMGSLIIIIFFYQRRLWPTQAAVAAAAAAATDTTATKTKQDDVGRPIHHQSSERLMLFLAIFA